VSYVERAFRQEEEMQNWEQGHFKKF